MPIEQFFIENTWALIALAAWIFPWKGVALWKAARLGQKWWFVILLVVNTLALLEIFYIFFVAKNKTTELAKTEKI